MNFIFMGISIRRITVADVNTLSAIAKKSFYDTFTGTCTQEDMAHFLEAHFNEKQLAKELHTENSHYYFAEVNSFPVAYLQFGEDYSGFPSMKKWKALELKRIYVLKEFHGGGVAQYLMEYYLAHALQHGYEVAWLGVWEHNIRAQRFYEKYGFAKSGYTHDFPIGKTPQTDVWLWKFLKD